MTRILIIGGGAAGMAAAIFAAEQGCRVHLFEQNEKLGKKLFITGKGRCNFTNACEMEDLFANIVTNPKFLYSAFYGFSNQAAIAFFEGLGVPTKVERGARVFPLSDHSSDIIRAMEARMRQLDVKIHLKSRVEELVMAEGGIEGCRLTNGAFIEGDCLIVATGGLSYPSTGSTGDGYTFARQAGHSISPLRAALVPFGVQEDYIRQMQGLALKNVTFSILEGKKKRFEGFGELLFTHFGISGPLALSASSYVGRYLEKGQLQGLLDLKPALTEEQVDGRLLREFNHAANKCFRNILPSLFPAKLVPVMVKLGGIEGDRPAHTITREERRDFAGLIKAFPFTLTSLRGYSEAIITQGGVSVREINPSTMESRYIKNLYFIGEVLDLDGVTGGFNLQIAWSTAYAAAMAAAGKEKNELSDCH